MYLTQLTGMASLGCTTLRTQHDFCRDKWQESDLGYKHCDSQDCGERGGCGPRWVRDAVTVILVIIVMGQGRHVFCGGWFQEVDPDLPGFLSLGIPWWALIGVKVRRVGGYSMLIAKACCERANDS